MDSAFQANAFQRDAFQVVVIAYPLFVSVVAVEKSSAQIDRQPKSTASVERSDD